ncbi:MAG: hypothetical protein F4011_04480 [Acidimicrobiaceae bacterium]|nr:hypothetical protein [Acidimicrobiaceae bacterium]
MQRFSDVPADHPQADAIAWAAGVGLTVGYGDGTFRPDDPLPRWAALIFMERFYDVLQASESDGFTRGDMMQLLHTIAAPPVAATSGDAAACAGLRRGRYYIYAGSAPERVEVTAVTVAFDDLAAPDEFYTAGLGQQPAQTFITELLSALEAKLEALSHGRTDWVFHRGSDVKLSGTAQSRSQLASLGRRTLAGMTGELRAMYPGKNLLAFTASDYDSPSFNPYTSFYSAGVASVAVTAIDEEYIADFFEPDLAHYQLSYSRFGQALFDAAHEVLHLVGLDDTYQIRANDGRGPTDSDSGQDSIMGLSSYGWGLGQIRSGGLLWARPWASHPGRGFFNGVMNLDEPSGNYPHGPMTGWNKWILGWLNDTEATCVLPDTANRHRASPSADHHQRDRTLVRSTLRMAGTRRAWRRLLATRQTRQQRTGPMGTRRADQTLRRQRNPGTATARLVGTRHQRPCHRDHPNIGHHSRSHRSRPVRSRRTSRPPAVLHRGAAKQPHHTVRRRHHRLRRRPHRTRPAAADGQPDRRGRHSAAPRSRNAKVQCHRINRSEFRWTRRRFLLCVRSHRSRPPHRRPRFHHRQRTTRSDRQHRTCLVNDAIKVATAAGPPRWRVPRSSRPAHSSCLRCPGSFRTGPVHRCGEPCRCGAPESIESPERRWPGHRLRGCRCRGRRDGWRRGSR